MMRNYEGKAPFVAHTQVPGGTRWQGTFPYDLFSFTLGGGAEYQLSGGKQSIGPGDFLHFAPQVWQDWRVPESSGWDVTYVIVDLPASLRDLLPEPSLAPGIGRLRLGAGEAERVAGTYREMLAWEERPSPLSERLILNQLEHALLLIRNTRPSASLDPRIERARAFLHHRCEETLSLSLVAQAAGLSKARLCALFKEALGLAPIEYLEQIRMERAARLLLFTATRIESISQQLGYNERKYFDKRFKHRWGVTPRQFRHRGTIHSHDSEANR